MRPLIIIVLAITILEQGRGSSKNATQRSRIRECHRESLVPETSIFPWEISTNENLIDLSWAYDASTIYWDDNESFDLNISTIVSRRSKSSFYISSNYWNFIGNVLQYYNRNPEHSETGSNMGTPLIDARSVRSARGEFHGTTAKDFYQVDRLCTASHGGTHIDAPRHFNPKRWTLDQIPLRRLFNIPTVIIDVKKKVVKNRGYLLSIRDLQLWENGHGPLPNNSLIIIRTGHHMLWGNREGYFGRQNGNSTRVFPSMGAKTARWLVHNRDIVGVGIDSPSIDGYPSLMGHRAFAKKNVYILENLGSHIDQAPKLGTYAFVMPLKIAGASGGPVRVVLRVPHSRPKPTTPNPAIS
ncbi:uncharacterized protein LOC111251308 [Varroa destructor]|uniref:Cyclase n=1 Tax=Varroa destructor TaxID=109461 RepID=A0A7M7KBX4_VARDE|nr:uncharacterized protein LOC111251308 [Varroa destructor]